MALHRFEEDGVVGSLLRWWSWRIRLGSIRIIWNWNVAEECVAIEVAPLQKCQVVEKMQSSAKEQMRAPSVHAGAIQDYFAFKIKSNQYFIFFLFSSSPSTEMASKSAPALKQIKGGDAPAEVLLSSCTLPASIVAALGMHSS